MKDINDQTLSIGDYVLDEEGALWSILKEGIPGIVSLQRATPKPLRFAVEHLDRALLLLRIETPTGKESKRDYAEAWKNSAHRQRMLDLWKKRVEKMDSLRSYLCST